MWRARTKAFLAKALLAGTLLAPASLVLAKPADQVSENRLRADVEALVGFGTRHTLSSQDDSARGIGAARRWAEARLRDTAAACGNCLEIALPEKIVQGDRVPVPTRLVDVVAIQRGTERPDEVVIVQGHIDSRVSDVMNATADAPGANDDASGTALVLEAARVLSVRKFPVTIVYAVLSGEEQGLLGGQLLAEHARAQGWKVKAVLNNDIVGNTMGSDGLIDDKTVRVFSEGPRVDGDETLRAAARRFGGENDSPGRNLSRFIAGLASPELAVRQIWRTDRMGRGGDHIPFLDAGIPAIRFSVGVENYDHQHQDLRRENGVEYGDTVDFMDFPYLARVTRLNVAALEHLASSPMPPVARADAAVKTWTDVSWQPVAGASAYRVWWRRTDESAWAASTRVAGDRLQLRLDGVRGDDWIFGVSAIAADGSESPVSSAVPGGSFGPLP